MIPAQLVYLPHGHSTADEKKIIYDPPYTPPKALKMPNDGVYST